MLVARAHSDHARSDTTTIGRFLHPSPVELQGIGLNRTGLRTIIGLARDRLMHSEGSLLELVGLVYDAAVDPQLWTPFVERLAQILRAPWCFFYVHDFSYHRVDIHAQ